MEASNAVPDKTKLVVQGRTFFVTSQKARNPNNVITGKLIINSSEVYTLFDTSSTHSFISPTCAQCLNLTSEKLDFDLSVETPLGETFVTFTIYKSCLIQIDTFTLPVDLISLKILAFDMILGINWLTTHHDFRKVVSFHIFNQPIM